MKIRKGTTNDLNCIVNFTLNLAKETESKELNKEVVKKGVLKILEGEIQGEYFVCEINGEIAGQIMILYEWSDWRNGYFIWIQSVYVDSKYRNKGVFKTMFDHIKDFCSSNSEFLGLRLYVDKNNKNAMEAYSKAGMYESNYKFYQYMK